MCIQIRKGHNVDDLHGIMCVDTAGAHRPWTEDEFKHRLDYSRKENSKKMLLVATDAADKGKVVGFLIFRIHEDQVLLNRLVVTPERRLEGIGTRLLSRVTGKIFADDHARMVARVRLRNIGALEFLCARGFKTCGVMHNHYEDNDDAIKLAYDFPLRPLTDDPINLEAA